MVDLANKERILELLYKTKRPMTTKEISQRLGLIYTSVPRYIQRLSHYVSSKKENKIYTYYISKNRLDSVQKRLNYLIKREGGNFEIDDENGLDTDTE